MRSGTTCLMRCCSSGDVCTVRCIPAVDEVPFLASFTTQMSTCRSGQCSRGATSSASESLPSACWPDCHATNPPKSERHAEPLPRRAIRDSADWDSTSRRPYSSATEAASAANPDADDASPAAVGKLFSEHRRRLYEESCSVSYPGAMRSTHLGQRRIGRLALRAQAAQLRDARAQPPALLDLVLDAIEPQAVLTRPIVHGAERPVGACRGDGTQMVLVQRHAQTVIRRQDQLRVALSPVLDDGNIHRRRARRLVDLGHGRRKVGSHVAHAPRVGRSANLPSASELNARARH